MTQKEPETRPLGWKTGHQSSRLITRQPGEGTEEGRRRSKEKKQPEPGGELTGMPAGMPVAETKPTERGASLDERPMRPSFFVELR
jgi:hypothetical protein